MAFVKTTDRLMIGESVTLTERKSSMTGYFEPGTVVTVADIDESRGYTFVDDLGNKVVECGWSGFKSNRQILHG